MRIQKMALKVYFDSFVSESVFDEIIFPAIKKDIKDQIEDKTKLFKDL